MRLWPVSRESMPKRFVSLIGNQSTFHQVLQCVSELSVFRAPKARVMLGEIERFEPTMPDYNGYGPIDQEQLSRRIRRGSA